MARPELTFFCEINSNSLLELLDKPGVIESLKMMGAGVSLGLIDLSTERAKAVTRLNREGIPVTAWLLLPKEQGYWFNMGNASQALERYREFRLWTQEHELLWARVALDIEPDFHELGALMQRDWRLLKPITLRLVSPTRYRESLKSYLQLVDEIHQDGYLVDSYIFPFIYDERMVNSSILQRAGGLLDIPADREVLMLYSSFLRPHGAGILGSYARFAQSIGVGSTGGGVDVEFADFEPLSWEELSRDLRLAWYFCNDIHVFSLEGCVQQGFLERLVNFTWDKPMLLPDAKIEAVNRWRKLLQVFLWVGAHPLYVLLFLLAIAFGWRMRYRLSRVNNYTGES